MERIKRNERLAVMSKILSSAPNRIFTLSYFCELFGAAKSTISEDINLLTSVYDQFSLGEISTVAGAAGGVLFRPMPEQDKRIALLEEISERLSVPGRLLPGGFLYTLDVMGDSKIAEGMGEILAGLFYEKKPDFVLTMETKGIPLALMVANKLGISLVIARRDSRAYEGPAVKINFVAGGSRDHIETMALARRAVSPGQKALIVDDFMKGGGTLRGMVDLMNEFSVEVVGIGVAITTELPEKKRVDNVRTLLTLRSTDELTASAKVTPSAWVYEDVQAITE